MSEQDEVVKIKGGWINVPPNLKTKIQLNQMGLKPIDVNKPRAEVWSYKSWYKLYDVELDTKPKKKPTAKQLEALEKAKEGRIRSLTCDECGEVQDSHRYITKTEDNKKICRWCSDYLWEKEKEEIAKEWARNHTFGKWFNEDFYILDTETTDLHGEIIEISIIDKEGNTIYDQLIKPFGKISEGARNVHQISDDMLSDKPTWKDVYGDLKPLLESKLILIYNSSFDREMIYNSCSKWKLEPPNLKTDCVMEAYADFVRSERWISLANASGYYFGHRALEDCKATLSVIKDVWNELGSVQSGNQ